MCSLTTAYSTLSLNHIHALFILNLQTMALVHHPKKLFKPQGIKSHEAHCRTRRIRERQWLDTTKQYEKVLEQVEESRAASFTAAHATVHASTSLEAGPSQPVYVHDNSNHDSLTSNICSSPPHGQEDSAIQDTWEPHGDPVT
ncbi:hypothetical protein BKA83DRAFT_4479244 [Pisolithus microcarpus]|nr:hypothetical protein BKA83DRAFT_4479244 [Pisolithus microcarpus]